jgi:hypothetical protein
MFARPITFTFIFLSVTISTFQVVWMLVKSVQMQQQLTTVEWMCLMAVNLQPKKLQSMTMVQSADEQRMSLLNLVPDANVHCLSETIASIQAQSDMSRLAKGASVESFYKPRILVGIFSDVRTEVAKEFRDRIRRYLRISNDTRLCSVEEFMEKGLNEDALLTDPMDILYDCQVVYTFVLGAYDVNASTPHFAKSIAGVPIRSMTSTVRLYDTSDKPLVLDTVPKSSEPKQTNYVDEAPYRDIYESKDGIFLNIIENMNKGKTPTFLYWASRLTKQMNIPYVAKCDSDTLLNLPMLFRFLHQQLPKVPAGPNALPPSVISGGMRRKDRGWIKSVDESLWTQQYYDGAHFFLSGGMYIMSQHLTQVATEEARKLEYVIPSVDAAEPRDVEQREREPHAYLEGHEDHDAIALIENGLSKSRKYHNCILQFLVIPKDSRFFQHGVKKLESWDYHLTIGESRRTDDLNHPSREPFGLRRSQAIPEEVIKIEERNNIGTLLVVFNATNELLQKKYVRDMTQQGYHVCNALQTLREEPNSICDIHYFFALGETSVNESSLLAPRVNLNATASNTIHHDVVTFNVNNQNQLGIGLRTLHFIKAHFNFDVIIASQAKYMVNIRKWKDVILPTAQYSLGPQKNQHMVIGDVRDKTRWIFPKKREFPQHCQGKYLRQQYEGVQLYLGNDCFAFSSNMIPLWLMESEKLASLEDYCVVGSLGHDLTFLSHLSTQTPVHWMAVPKQLQFWS